jgi:hypothetical protein
MWLKFKTILYVGWNNFTPFLVRLWQNVRYYNFTCTLSLNVFLHEKWCQILLCLPCTCSSPCSQSILHLNKCYKCPDVKEKLVCVHAYKA